MDKWQVSPEVCTISNGHTAKLDYKQMQLLCFLAQNAQKVLSRNEILDEVWRDQIVADDVLNVAVSGLRKALGDDSKAPHIIKTIPKVGYQLIAEVNFAVAENNETVPRSKLVYLITTTLILAALSLVVIWPESEGTRANNSTKYTSKLMVLPTKLKVNSPDAQYLANSLTETLISQLANESELRVVSYQSAYEAVERKMSKEQLVSELGIDFIVTNELSVQDSKLDIATELTNLKSGQSDWKKQYSTPAHNLYATQITMANEIAKRFQTTDRFQITDNPSSLLSVNGKAYDLYLQALYHIRQNQYTLAEQFFLNSINESEQFAPAFAGLAQLYFLKARRGREKALDYMRVAKRYADKATELDNSHPQSLLNSALVAYFLKYDLAQAKTLFEKALMQNPSDIMILEWYLSFLVNTGDFDTAKTINQKMRDISPLLFNKTAYYDILYFSGNYTGALSEIESVNPYMRSEFWASAESAWVYLSLKDSDKFASAFVKVMQFYDIPGQQVEVFQQVLATEGIEPGLLLFLELAGDAVDDFTRAEILAVAGKKSEAIQALTNLVKHREIQAFKIPISPLLSSLHSEADYKVLMRALLAPVGS